MKIKTLKKIIQHFITFSIFLIIIKLFKPNLMNWYTTLIPFIILFSLSFIYFCILGFILIMTYYWRKNPQGEFEKDISANCHYCGKPFIIPLIHNKGEKIYHNHCKKEL